jgi:hypothetical protein
VKKEKSRNWRELKILMEEKIWKQAQWIDSFSLLLATLKIEESIKQF